MALSQFNHPTRLTILRWHLFVWVDLYNGMLGLSSLLKGTTKLPQNGLVLFPTSSLYDLPQPQIPTQPLNMHTETHSSLCFFFFLRISSFKYSLIMCGGFKMLVLLLWLNKYNTD